MTDLNVAGTVSDGGGLRTFLSPTKANDAQYNSFAFLAAYFATASDHKTAIIKTDLGSAQSVGAMTVYTSNANLPWTSVEYASSTSGPWTGVSGLSIVYSPGAGPLGTTEGQITFDAASARYWRLVWDYIAGPGYQAQRNLNAWEIYAAAPTPPPPPGVTVTINEVEFGNPKELTIRNELNAAGQMTLVLDRNDVQATAVNLTAGSICRVTFTEIDPDPIAAFILESGDWDLISSDEEGGEELRYTGPGVLWLLHRAVVAFEEYEPSITAGAVYPNRGRWEFGDSITAGRIIHKLVSEALSSSRPQAPLAGVSIDFTASVDSNGDAWTVNIDGRWRTPIGRNLYGEVQRIAVAADISIEMGPDLVLHAYNSRGTDRTGSSFGSGVVRFAKGANIADELTRSQDGRGFVSHGQVHWGDSGDYGWITKSGSWPYVQEAPYDEDTDNHTTANRAARAKMGWKERAQDAPGFAHKVPWPGAGNDELTGDYLPGPDWTENGLYWLGDTITAHTGTADLDYDEADGIVYAITLMLDQTGFLAPPFVELNAPFGESEAATSSTSVVSNAVSSSGSSDGGGGGTTLIGLYEKAIEGGDPVVMPHGNTGSTETIDPTDGNVHTLTLDANCTFTINPPVGQAATLELWITQDGTGGWVIAWPGSVTLQGTLDTTASTTSRVILDTVDAGTTWIATVVGGDSPAGLVTVTDGTSTVSPATTMTVPLGGVADLGGNNADLRFLTSRYGSQPAVVTDDDVSGSYAIDCSMGNWFDLTLTGNTTLSITNPPPAAGEIFVILRQGGAGSKTVTWPGSVDWQDTDGTGGGAAVTLHTAVDAVNIIGLATVDGGTTWGAADEAGGGSSDPSLGGDLSGTASAASVDAVKGVVVTDAGTTGTVLTKTGAATATWSTPAASSGHFEILMASGSADPLLTSDGLDYLYVEVP